MNHPKFDHIGGAPMVGSVLDPKERPYRGIEFFDDTNPRSLINILPEFVANEARRIPPELWELTEDQYEGRLKLKIKASPEIRMLRVAFWYEYDRAQVMMRKMNMSNVFGGVCSMTYFRRKVVPDHQVLAYIMTPVAEYEITIKELLVEGLRQVRDILQLSHVNKDGTPNTKMAQVKVDIVKDLITRDRGSVVHKIESKNLHMNVNAEMPPDVRDLRSVEREIKELEVQLVEGDGGDELG